MQLVPEIQHTNGSPFWNTLHPNGKGGVGASLTGGNFWKGATTGLIVGVFSQFSQGIERAEDANYDPTKVSKSNPDEIATGDVVNLHNNGSALDLWAQQSKPSNGTVELHVHAYEQGLAGFTSVEQISTLLYA